MQREAEHQAVSQGFLLPFQCSTFFVCSFAALIVLRQPAASGAVVISPDLKTSAAETKLGTQISIVPFGREDDVVLFLTLDTDHKER